MSAALPLELPEELRDALSQTTVDAGEKGKMPPLVELVRVSSLDIRKRLFDPPPPPPKPNKPKRQKPPPAVKLVGTVLHPSDPVAMIADSKGRVAFKKLGDEVGDEDNVAVVLAIEKTVVRLQHEGRTIEISLDKEKGR